MCTLVQLESCLSLNIRKKVVLNTMIMCQFLRPFVMGKLAMRIIKFVKRVYITGKVNKVSRNVFALVYSLADNFSLMSVYNITRNELCA